jgi:hypothetical protein
MSGRRDLRKQSDDIRKKGPFFYGILGDANGNLHPLDESGNERPEWWVRVVRPNGYEPGIYSGSVRGWLNLPVKIETDPLTGRQVIIDIDANALQAGEIAGNPAIPPGIWDLPLHGSTHEFREDADDMLAWLSMHQIYELRVQPSETAGHIVVQGGAYYCAEEFHFVRDPVDVDLTSYYDASEERWVLIYLDANGAVQVYAPGVSELEDLSIPPVDCYVSAAVRLRPPLVPVDWFAGDIPDLRLSGQQTTAPSFLRLSDTPDSYTGQSKKLVRVNTGETALEFGADLDDLSNVDAASPASGDGLGWDGSKWTPTDYTTPAEVDQIIRENFLTQAEIFLQTAAADVATYQKIVNTPDTAAETVYTANCTSSTGEVLIKSFITYPVTGIGITRIPGGAWHAPTYCKVSLATGITKIVIRVYKRTAGGVETELFSLTTDEINETSVTNHEIDAAIGAHDVAATDRLVFKYFAVTTHTVTITVSLYVAGIGNATHIHTPFGGGVAEISVADTPTIDLDLNPTTHVLSANLTATLGDLTDVLVDSHDDGFTLVGNESEGAYESRKLKFIELEAVPGSYTNAGGFGVRVKPDATGLEFLDDRAALLIATLLGLPGLRFLYNMSSLDNSGNVYDLSGQGRTLTNNGTVTFNSINGAGYGVFSSASSQYLSRSHEAGLTIQGNESYMASDIRGFTVITIARIRSYAISPTGYHGLVSKYSTTPSASAFFLGTLDSQSSINFVMNNGSGYYGDINVALAVETWAIISARFLPSSRIDLDVNGNNANVTVGVPATMNASVQPLDIGYAPGLNHANADIGITAGFASWFSNDTIALLRALAKPVYGLP